MFLEKALTYEIGGDFEERRLFFFSLMISYFSQPLYKVRLMMAYFITTDYKGYAHHQHADFTF